MWILNEMKLTFFIWILISIVLIDGNQFRRRRRQISSNSPGEPIRHDEQINKEKVNRNGKNLFGINRFPQQPSRQFGYGQYGNIMGLNYPYAGAGMGSYQYGSYNPSNSMSSLYGSYYNQYNPSSNSFYGSNYFNRPGYSNSYYSPYGSGSSFYGGYYYGHSTSIYQQNSFFLLFSFVFISIYSKF